MSENTWTVTGPQTIDVDGVHSLQLGIFRGRFDIVTHDEDVARIEVSEIEGDPLSVSIVNGRLEVRHQLHGPQGWFKNLMSTVNNGSSNSVVISIALPAGGTAGNLSVNTVSGEVIARNHRGVLTAKSVSGEVTASGEFSNIRANTVSGDLNFDLHGFTHDFGANSVDGDATIRLPHDVGVDIVAKSASGAVVIDDTRYVQPGGTVQTIAGPDAKLMLVRTNSVSGKTSLFHGQPSPDTETAL